MKDKSNTMLNSDADVLYNLHYVRKCNTWQKFLGNEPKPLEPVPVASIKDDILNYIREYLPDEAEALPILHNELPTSITITIHHHNKKHTVATWQKDIQKGGVK